MNQTDEPFGIPIAEGPASGRRDSERLTPLARRILMISHADRATPVLVTPKCLSLRQPFFAALGWAVQDLLGPDSQFSGIRIDRVRAGRWLLPWSTGKTRPIVLATGKLPLRIETTLTIGRQGGFNSDLVVGYATDDVELPVWTIPIGLSQRSSVPAIDVAVESAA